MPSQQKIRCCSLKLPPIAIGHEIIISTFALPSDRISVCCSNIEKCTREIAFVFIRRTENRYICGCFTIYPQSIIKSGIHNHTRTVITFTAVSRIVRRNEVMQVAISLFAPGFCSKPRVSEHVFNITVSNTGSRIACVEIAFIERIHINYAIIRFITIGIIKSLPCFSVTGSIIKQRSESSSCERTESGFQRRAAFTINRGIVAGRRRTFTRPGEKGDKKKENERYVSLGIQGYILFLRKSVQS